ncbi:MAG TPA: hypothetical protein VJ850_09610 [Candidatus Limnocylindrales bacterium]|nr:hypothetical protein [Candidatus Limnocylindrales bacterium]
MSFLAALAPRLASLAAQPAVLAAGVATGVAVGAVGVGTGAIPVTDPGPRLVALYECPDAGRVVKSLQSSQSVLVTARTADGQWLEIYLGEAGAERGWARASSLQLKAAPDSLPVDDCTPSATGEPTFASTLGPPSGPSSLEPSASALPASIPASVAPSATATSAPSASLAPTKTPKPTPTPGPTPTPFFGPFLSDLVISDPPADAGTGRYYIWPTGCSLNFHVGFELNATDPDGMETVYLWVKPVGVSAVSYFAQYEGSSSDNNGQYYAEFQSDIGWGDGIVQYWFVGEDSLGNQSPPLYGGSDQIVELKYCAD